MVIELRITKDLDSGLWSESLWVDKCRVYSDSVDPEVAEEFSILELQQAMKVVANCKTINKQNNERISDRD